jgi:hypothetical protein
MFQKRKGWKRKKNGSPLRERMEVGGKKIETKSLPIPKKEVEDK